MKPCTLEMYPSEIAEPGRPPPLTKYQTDHLMIGTVDSESDAYSWVVSQIL